MYGFTKNFTLAIFSSILIGTLALSYFTVNKNQQQSTFEDFNEQQFCAHDHLLQNAVESDPAIKAKVDGQEAQFYTHMTSSASLTESTFADFTLPVVVHIIHQNGQEDIPNTQVEQAIQDLNDGFANTLNTEIEFCLAKNNPEGNPSTGVTRTESPLTNVTIETEDLMLKDLDRWDPTKYINIWVVKSIGSDALLGPVRGYSYLPAFHGTNRDGVVIEAAFMGSTPENSKVLVHELGHYLGLYHTFYGGCGNDDCLLDGDRICDTPPDWTVALAPCEVTENSCYTDVNAADANNPFTSDQNDLRENYMDINPLECYEAFTQGQADRMTFFINGARSSLLGSTVCDTDCDTPVENLSFAPSNDTIIPIGTQLSFVSTSVNATIFDWTLNGTSVSTAANLVQLFDEAGTFTLTLTAGNADVDCNIIYSIQITVIDCFGNSHVSDATGNDVFMCGQPGNPCKTIQYALDNVICTGDTIFIHSGTYGLPAATPVTTPIALIPEDYTVTFFGVEDNGDVIIDGENFRRGFVYNYTGTNCPPVFPDNGIAALHQINFAHLTIQNTESLEETCTDGTSSAAGSALYLVNALESTLDVTIDDCTFLNNISVDDDINNDGRTATGAIFFNGRVEDTSPANTNSSITITNSEFSNNRAEQVANGGTGGALALFLVKEINISDSYFCNNSVFTSNGDAGDFDLNRNSGGAIIIYDKSNFLPPNALNHTINNCYFFDNSATSTNGGGFFNNSEGGAIFLSGDLNGASTTSTATLNITNSHFYNNTIETGIEHFDNTVGTIIQSGNTLENNPFTFSLGNDTTICNIDSITIGTSILGSDYAWNTGATTPMITVSDTGMYILNISMGACEYIDTIVISEMICGEICGNGIDDDGDGLIDCFDPECCGQLACDEHYYNECANSCEFSNNDSDVQAELKWQSNTTVSISSTPITGDIDGDGIPEVIIPTQSTTSSNLSVIDGLTGGLKFEIALPFNGDESGNLAIADVDNDGTAEIFNYRGATIYRYEHDGTLSASMATLGSAVGFSQRVGIADFDGNGVAEIYANNKIFNSTDLSILANIPVTSADAQYAVAVDVLDDAACGNCEGLELVMGNKVYSINITTGFVTVVLEADLNMPNGIVSIADLDKDGDLDAVVSANLPSNSTNSPHMIYAWDIQTNTIMGQFDPGDNASQSTVADFDGDGQLEIAFKTSSNLIVLENDFTQKWSTASLEDEANFTAPVSFDFDGDGDFEIVARGTEELQIFDGTNGNVLFSAPAFSGTRAESPVIVDVDGDGLTEILISSAATQNDADNDIGFLKAYGSASFPWQSTRKVWNQSNYFNVNIKDDLTIPMMQQQHHIVGNDVILNNFLTQHGEQLGADASIASVDVLCALNDLIVTLEVCNTGQNELSYTTPITFYRDNPTTTATSALDTEELGVTIPVDSCATVEFTIPAQYDDPVFIVVNDDNSTNTPFDLATDFPNTNIGECDYTNNMDVFTEMPEPYELDLGGTIMICDNAAIELNATTHFVSYEWQDGTTDSVFTAYGGGEYWVTVIDSCGGTQVDTVELAVIPNTINMTMPTNAIVCPTQDTSFTVMGDFDTYKWIPNDFLDCDTCQTVQVIDPDEETQYIVTASNSLTGCYSVDTVLLSFTSISTSDNFQVCAGESVDIHGNMTSTPGTYSETFTSVEGCDSTSTITLTNFDELTLSFQTTPTCPQGNQGAISVFVSNGVATNYSWSVSGAGNNPTVNNLLAGIYTVTIIDGNNCENIGSTEIIEDNNLPITTDFIAPTCPGGSDGSLEILNPMATWTFSMDGTTFQDSPIFTELSAGTYDIFIQDGDCLYSGMTGTIDDPAGISISGNVINGATYLNSTLINVVVNGDHPITNIDWSSSTGVGGLSCTDCLTPMLLATQETEVYTITVTDSEGCTASADFTITTTFPCNPESIEVPNVFTPDGDGVNDSFTAVIKEGLEEVAEMRIYNRWGNVVFESTNGLQPWDGKDGEKLAPMDVYVYVITIQCSVGEEKRVVKSGDVTLVR